MSQAVEDMNSRKKITPETLEELQASIIEQYDAMSNRLRLVGEFFVRNPNVVALENMVSIASEVDVSPSTLVRFANFFGFKGFSDLQQLYRGQLKGQVNGYRERVRTAPVEAGSEQGGHQLLEALSHNQAIAVEDVAKDISPEAFEKALDMMEQAQTIYVSGVRRAFPVAYYLTYALMRADMNVVLIDDSGALHKNQLKRAGFRDLLLAVSYHPHADETAECINIAAERKSQILVLTDHSFHPCKNSITHALEIKEAEMMGMRSLSGSLHLAQSLVMGLLYRLEK